MIEPVIDELEAALGRRCFPPKYQEWGNQLLSQLRTPVQIAVIGLPGQGKSTLIDVLLGERIGAGTVESPFVTVVHGREPRVIYENADGAKTSRPGLMSDEPMPDGTVHVRQELPRRQLLRQNYVEVALTDDYDDQAAALCWAVQWADVIIWCTSGFSPAEQHLWSAVPDNVKDHSFLVLSMADRQLMKGTLAGAIDKLAPVVAEQFLGLYPIASLQALAARAAETGETSGLWSASGARALTDDIEQQVNVGRAADLDQAWMLLDRFAPERDAPLVPAAAAAPGPRPMAPAAALAGARLAAATGLADQTDQVLTSAIGTIDESAQKMLGIISDFNESDVDAVLSCCVETARSLSDILVAADTGDPDIRQLQDDIQESEEMMLLFQLEKGEDAAEDAITLLLQLKKELSEKT